MILLDSHALAWLYADPALVPKSLLARIDSEGVAVSPAAVLEAERWRELGRLTVASRDIVEQLRERIGLVVEGRLMAEAVLEARAWPEAGDAIDRIILAQAFLLDLPLATKNQRIRALYKRAFWE
jgi:PIN domain nuclease of toxin-antitoxin system